MTPAHLLLLVVAMGPTPNERLIQAVKAGQVEVAQELVSNPAVDVNFQDKDGRSALMLAIHEGHAGLARWLVAHGANPNLGDRLGYTSLIFAVQAQDPELVQELLRLGVDINATDIDGRTAYTWARIGGFEEIGDLLTSNGAQNIEPKEPFRMGPGVTAPVPLHMEQPEYPDRTLAKRVHGEIAVEVLIQKNGRSVPRRVIRGLEKTLDESALKASRKWRFKPAEWQGGPVDCIGEISFSFKIFK